MYWIMQLFVRFILWLGRARWIIDGDGLPGFRIFGVVVSYYKWDDSFIVDRTGDEDWRLAEKREIISNKLATMRWKRILEDVLTDGMNGDAFRRLVPHIQDDPLLSEIMLGIDVDPNDAHFYFTKPTTDEKETP